MRESIVHEQLAAIAEVFGWYASAAISQAIRDYQDELWFDWERPFFDDEMGYEEFERGRAMLKAKWTEEVERRGQQAMADALQSEELQELLSGVDDGGFDLADMEAVDHEVLSDALDGRGD